MPAAKIEEPYSLATLPNPLDNNFGRIHGAPVYGYRAGQKRKRHEVVVGIDGEGVNIYNVQHQNLTTSYGLPPRTRLCCAPTSIHVKQPTSTEAQRETYLVVKDGERDSRRRLLCIREVVSSAQRSSNSEGLGTQKPTIQEQEIPSEGQIVGLDVISRSDAGRTQAQNQPCSSLIVVAFESGDVWWYNTASSQTWHERDPEIMNCDSYEVQHSALVDFNTAKRGLLRHRADVIAALDPKTNSRAASHFILCQVVHNSSIAQLRLYILRNSEDVQEQAFSSRLQHVLSYDLPISLKAISAESLYGLHVQSGVLYHLSRGRLSAFDVTSLRPKLLFQLRKKQNEIIHFIRLSASSVMGISGETAAIFETEFSSELTTVPLSAFRTPSNDGKKRKREEGSGNGLFVPISAFADLGLVVGIAGQELQCLSFSYGQRPTKRSRSQSFLLVDVINKGNIPGPPRALQSDQKVQKWQDWKAQVDQMLDNNDADGLERLVMDVKRPKSADTKGTKDFAQPEELTNGTTIPSLPHYVKFRGSALRSTDTRKALYLLKKTFKAPSEREHGLNIHFSSQALLTWLAYHNFLSVPVLQKALARENLRSGDIFQALAQFDSSFQIISSLLALPVQWDATEMVETLRILLQSFRTPSRDGVQLSHVPAPRAGTDVEMNDFNAEAELRHETEAAFQELDLTSALFKHGLEVRGHILHAVLARLHTFQPNTVSSIMRARLTHEDLVFFIELMRLELAYGGWTSRYVDAGEDEFEEGMVNALGSEEEGGPSDQAIKAITDLLNCAVDAIGINGWLVGLSGHLRQATELIETLRTEVSAGLEGCYEAAMMGDFVNMVEQCSAPSQVKQDPIDGADSSKSVLPLAGRNDSAAARPRTSTPKSKIAVAQEKSRTVGKYSIDRVRI